jgi:hypothetical protein
MSEFLVEIKNQIEYIVQVFVPTIFLISIGVMLLIIREKIKK